MLTSAPTIIRLTTLTVLTIAAAVLTAEAAADPHPMPDGGRIVWWDTRDATTAAILAALVLWPVASILLRPARRPRRSRRADRPRRALATTPGTAAPALAGVVGTGAALHVAAAHPSPGGAAATVPVPYEGSGAGTTCTPIATVPTGGTA